MSSSSRFLSEVVARQRPHLRLAPAVQPEYLSVDFGRVRLGKEPVQGSDQIGHGPALLSRQENAPMMGVGLGEDHEVLDIECEETTTLSRRGEQLLLILGVVVDPVCRRAGDVVPFCRQGLV